MICWPTERWTRAGYSCPAPGEVTRIGPFLNRPFHGRLVFAGEHCCLPFFGYMEGAGIGHHAERGPYLNRAPKTASVQLLPVLFSGH
ncbi:FAD-dependent oxidoreductase [Bradyrhizobium ottawaense]|uniref:FAD-dependent oxidoreductase n=1 Tax=Bradyrhizobium ottawaense TaxID=931866 RepID=UPI00351418DE